MKHPYGQKPPQPTQPIRWPAQDAIEIQQVKTASEPSRVTQGSVSQVASQNMPKPVKIIGITKQPVNATTRQLSINFVRDPADSYYQKVNVHLRLGIGQPTQIASSVSSPIRVSVPVSAAPATFILQTEGSWGANPLQNSPVKSLSLL
jgi:hypothetical protein